MRRLIVGEKSKLIMHLLFYKIAWPWILTNLFKLTLGNAAAPEILIGNVLQEIKLWRLLIYVQKKRKICAILLVK